MSKSRRYRRPILPASAGNVGTEVELDVTDVAHGGIFVARLDGRVVFVTDALPGERVRARISQDSHKNFWRAETISVLSESPHRREHIWPEARLERDPSLRPGGADFGHIDLAFQRELKSRVVCDSFARFASHGVSVTVEPVRGDVERNGLEWRTRETLHVDSSGLVGPYASRSHRVIEVAGLPLTTSELQAAAPLRERRPGAARLSLIHADSGVVVLEHVTGEKTDAPVITQRVNDREFTLRATGFWQVHRDASRVLSEVVSRVVDDDTFDTEAANLDLYGGVGLLAAALGDKFGRETRITSIELDDDATDFAAENLADWIGAHAITARVDEYLSHLVTSSSVAERSRLASGTVILDPPRSGAGLSVVDSLTTLRPAQIVYVACDPVALARDALLLQQRGYHLEHIEAHDLFPHTHHVETVATFTRA